MQHLYEYPQLIAIILPDIFFLVMRAWLVILENNFGFSLKIALAAPTMLSIISGVQFPCSEPNVKGGLLISQEFQNFQKLAHCAVQNVGPIIDPVIPVVLCSDDF